MEQTALCLTRYYRDVQDRANLQDYDFSSSSPFNEAPLDEITSGRLSSEITAALFQQASERKSGSKRRTDSRSAAMPEMPAKNAKPIDLVISLVTLEGRKKNGLLLLPASLQPDGALVADLETKAPWIPASRLSSAKVTDLEVMVGRLSSFWSYRLKKWPEEVSKAESWTGSVQATQRMFATVAASDLDKVAADVGTEIIRDRCFISTDEVIVANGAILDLYKFLSETNPAAPAYERLISLAGVQQYDSDAIDHDGNTLKSAALASCGSMSDQHPLTPSQRRAVHAIALDALGQNPVTAVSGPPGTGKTTMLQSVVASTIVRHALDGRHAPLIVGTSTNNQAVTNIIDSFNSVTKDVPGPLDRRWLPRADEDGATEKSLLGLAAYCPSQRKARNARANGYLVEDNRKGGVYTEYSDSDYVARATTFFLARLRDYADSTGGVVRAATSLGDAINALRNALTRVDQARTSLIEKKSAAGKSRAAMDENYFGGQIENLERERERCRSRLEFWTETHTRAAAHPNRQPQDDYFVIEQNYDPNEPAGRRANLADYIAFYRYWVEEWSGRIDDVRVRHKMAKDQVASESAPTPVIDEAVRWIQRLGIVDDATSYEIGHATSLLELDRLLDTSARYTEFWLAVHLYEAEWLQTASGTTLIRKDVRWQTTAEVMDRYWNQLPALTPCFVMTAYQLPKYFKLSKKGRGHTFDLGRADLLIVDEAGQVDTSVGAAAFAVTKRALVVGDVQQLAPVWSIDPVSDSEIAGVHGLSECWPGMEERGLTSSDHSSVMATASAASNWSFGPDRLPGLFLSEHFRCHPAIIEYCNKLLYKGLLRPKRPLDGYMLNGRTPSPFLFCEVPGSQDKRSGSSRVNEREAVAVAEWLVANYDYFDDIYNADGTSPVSVIGVVTPFAAQAKLITRKLIEAGDASLSKKITVGTAHRLQGAERPVVVFSSVYGDNSPQASFIDGTLELMNVAVSRAKDLFIVFGGAARRKDDGPVFSLVREYATLDDCNFSSPEASTPGAAGTPWAAHEDQDLPRTVVEPNVADAPVSRAFDMVDRAQPGYVIGKDLVAQCGTTGMLPNQQKFSVKDLNAALENTGLLKRTVDGMIPTVAGSALGIAAYEGIGQSGRYVNVIYSPQAQEALAAMMRDGRLGSA